MENWKKIQSFSRAYEADLRKEVLKNNNISAVVLAKQDSSFLLGDFELYVEQQDFEAAGIVLQEFRGWTKVNSFPVLKPVTTIHKYLEEEQIEVFFTKNNQVDEYELYVKNEDAEKAFELINTIKPWVLLNSYETVTQAVYRVQQLAKYEIDSIIIKRRASDKHLINVDVLVTPTQYKLAVQVTNEMVGWHLVEQYQTKTEAFLAIKMLEKEGIDILTKFVVSSEDSIKQIELYTNFEKVAHCKELIAQKREWVELARFEKLYQVEIVREILKQNNIKSVFINEKSSMFLLGEMPLYIEKKDVEKAKEYLESWTEVLGGIDEENLTQM